LLTRNRDKLAVYNVGIDAATYERRAVEYAYYGSAKALGPDQPPGFIVVLGLLFRWFGQSRFAAKIIFCGLITLTAGLTWLIGRRFDSLAAAIATLVVVSSALLRAYAATLQYEIPAMFLWTVAAALTIVGGASASRTRSLIFAALAALVCALGALTREVLAVAFPILLITIVANRTLSLRSRLSISALATAIFAIIVGGWIIHQSRVAGHFVVISDKAGINFRIGNNPNANGTYNLVATDIAEPSGRRSFEAARPRRCGSPDERFCTFAA
jgi:4-amino-4-deoxy-L-arabinose transferase-like glycosyltransferase